MALSEHASFEVTVANSQLIADHSDATDRLISQILNEINTQGRGKLKMRSSSMFSLIIYIL